MKNTKIQVPSILAAKNKIDSLGKEHFDAQERKKDSEARIELTKEEARKLLDLFGQPVTAKTKALSGNQYEFTVTDVEGGAQVDYAKAEQVLDKVTLKRCTIPSLDIKEFTKMVDAGQISPAQARQIVTQKPGSTRCAFKKIQR